MNNRQNSFAVQREGLTVICVVLYVLVYIRSSTSIETAIHYIFIKKQEPFDALHGLILNISMKGGAM